MNCLLDVSLYNLNRAFVTGIIPQKMFSGKTSSVQDLTSVTKIDQTVITYPNKQNTFFGSIPVDRRIQPLSTP